MDHQSKAETFHKEAVEAAFSHNQPKALELITSALELQPTSAKYAIEKAEILCEMNKALEAISFLEKGGFVPQEPIDVEIRKIRSELESDKIPPKDSEGWKKLERLLQWGKENGMDTSNMKIVYYAPDFRGVHAARRIRKGERIVVAPEKVLVTLPKVLEASPLARKVINCGLTLEYTFGTAVACMIYEAKNDEKHWWRPYAESFPEDTATYPYFFSDKEKEYLKGTEAEKMMVTEMKECIDEYDAICEKVPEMKKMTREGYLKLLTLAGSRYFNVSSLADSKLAVPITDMFNFYIDKVGQTKWDYIPEEKAHVVTALEDINRGEVIGLNYGNKTNAKFLTYYGFIPEGNSRVCFYMKPFMSEKDPLLKEKRALLFYEDGEMFMFAKHFYVYRKNKPADNQKIMSSFRYIAYEGDVKVLAEHLDKLGYDKETRYRKVLLPPLSIDNEIKALTLLKEFVMEKLGKFPNGCEKDEEMLRSDTTLSLNARNALTIRVGEQKGYRKIVGFVDHMVKLLKKDKSEALKEAATVPNEPMYKDYVQAAVIPLLTK